MIRRGLGVALASALTLGLLAAGGAGAAEGDGVSAHERALLAYQRLTPRQRIGQLFMPGVTTAGVPASERRALARSAIGNAYLREASTAPVGTIAARTRRIDQMATYARVRPFIGTDQEGGLVQRLTGRGFSRMPTALSQGRLRSTRLEALARRWGRQLSRAGVTMDLAPVADVVPARGARRNQPIGRYQREYGHTPVRAGRHVAAFTRGLGDAGVAATLKHFPGLGRASGNTDDTGRVTDPTGPRDPYLRSFEHGIDAGAEFVMVSSAIYPHIDRRNRACFSPTVMGILRDRLGFTGVIVSDSFGAAALGGTRLGERAVRFFRAGGTMILDSAPTHVAAMARAVRERMRTHPRFRTRIRAAVLTVLETKAVHGLIG